MADVTISQLTKGTPTNNGLIPYSTGTSTLAVPVSGLFLGARNFPIGTSSSAWALSSSLVAFSYSPTPGPDDFSHGLYLVNNPLTPNTRTIGIFSQGMCTDTSNSSQYTTGLESRAWSRNTTSGPVVPYLIGLNSYAFNQGISSGTDCGTVDQAIGIRTGVQNYYNTGTINSAIGLKIDINTNNYGTVKNSYAIYITDQSQNAYGIYQASANTKNYFNGKVGIGTTTPTAKLEVVGDVKASNTAKAWVLFNGGSVINGAGDVSVYSSYNVTRVNRTQQGVYSIYLTNPLADANYAIAGSVPNTGQFVSGGVYSSASRSSSIVYVSTGMSSSNLTDMNYTSVIVYGT